MFIEIFLTNEISTTIAQFMLRKTCPKNMRTKAPTIPPDTGVAKALKMNGAEMMRPTPQITDIKVKRTGIKKDNLICNFD